MPKRRILICDDEPILRELMRLALDGKYDFEEAGDTQGAVDQLLEFRPDLVLLDLMMPGGGGLAVIDRMRREPDLGSTRVIVISAFSGDDDRTAARDAGADAFVAKPFDPDELSARVEELLAGGS